MEEPSAYGAVIIALISAVVTVAGWLTKRKQDKAITEKTGVESAGVLNEMALNYARTLQDENESLKARIDALRDQVVALEHNERILRAALIKNHIDVPELEEV